MRVKSVAFGFTKNLGNFQSARVDVSVELAEGESFDRALDLAQAVVNEALDQDMSPEMQALLDAERARAATSLEFKR